MPEPARTFGRRRLFATAAGAYLAVLALLMLLENYLIFPAPRYPSGDWDPAHPRVEDIYFRSADGTQLHGWYLEHPQPRGVLLYCHGNGEHVAHLAGLMQLLHDELRCSVFVFDYRGYGRSEGSPSEAGITADGHAAHRWLTERTRLPADCLVLMGRSLGGAVAVDLAAEHSAAALVLENTFTSLPDVAAPIYWWAPVRWLMRSKFDSINKIDQYSGPIFQSHGTQDGLVPLELGRSLFAAAGGHGEFLELPGDGHNDPPPIEYYSRLDQFLEGVLHH